MLWAHVEAFRIARPEPFFEIMLALRDWIDAREYLKAALADIGNSRPIRRADSFAHHYRDYRQRLAAGDETARWVSFQEGPFHAWARLTRKPSNDGKQIGRSSWRDRGCKYV